MTYLREKLSQKPAYQRREDNRHEMTWQQLRKWGSWDLGKVRKDQQGFPKSLGKLTRVC